MNEKVNCLAIHVFTQTNGEATLPFRERLLEVCAEVECIAYLKYDNWYSVMRAKHNYVDIFLWKNYT